MTGKKVWLVTGADPAKLAAALVQIVDQDNPPVRLVAGADAVAAVEQKARDLLAQVDAYRDIRPRSRSRERRRPRQDRRLDELRPFGLDRRARPRSSSSNSDTGRGGSAARRGCKTCDQSSKQPRRW